MVHHEVGDHPDLALVRLLHERGEVVGGPVVGMHGVVVGDVVTAVAQRRRVERQEPDAVDAEPLEVVEALGEADEVADAVAVAVGEAADVDLVEHRPLEPERVRLEPAGCSLGRRSGRAELPAQVPQLGTTDDQLAGGHRTANTCAPPGGSRT